MGTNYSFKVFIPLIFQRTSVRISGGVLTGYIFSSINLQVRDQLWIDIDKPNCFSVDTNPDIETEGCGIASGPEQDEIMISGSF